MDETHPLPRRTIAGENVSVQNSATLSPFIYTVNCCCCSFLPNIKSPPSACCFGKLKNVVSFFPCPMTINEIPCLFSLLCSCVFSMLLLATLLFRHMRLIFKFAELSWVGAAPAHTLHLHCNSCPTLARGLSRDQLGGAVQFFLIENSLFGPRDVLLRKNSCSFGDCSNYLPHPPIRSTCTTFFLTKKFRIWKSLRIKSTIYIIYIQPKTVKSSNSWHFVRNRLLL